MDVPAANTLSKKERLCSKKDIAALLAHGSHGGLPGMKYCIRKGTGESVNRILVSVPKKFFKRAVKRNLLKRRIRESYRTQKSLLPSGGVDIMFVYNSKEVMSSAAIRETVASILENAAR